MHHQPDGHEFTSSVEPRGMREALHAITMVCKRAIELNFELENAKPHLQTGESDSAGFGWA